tara:strand:+ start:50 stop:160 length:111 start_codon:yes stop_codon:yes gene_type:complete
MYGTGRYGSKMGKMPTDKKKKAATKAKAKPKAKKMK